MEGKGFRQVFDSAYDWCLFFPMNMGCWKCNAVQ